MGRPGASEAGLLRFGVFLLCGISDDTREVSRGGVGWTYVRGAEVRQVRYHEVCTGWENRHLQQDRYLGKEGWMPFVLTVQYCIVQY